MTPRMKTNPALSTHVYQTVYQVFSLSMDWSKDPDELLLRMRNILAQAYKATYDERKLLDATGFKFKVTHEPRARTRN